MRVLLRLLALVCLAAVFFGLLADLSTVESTAPAYADKLVHAALFACVSICLAILLPRLTAPVLLLTTIAIGALTEGLQGLVGRDPSWGDLLANAVGASLVLVVALIARVYPDRRSSGSRRADPSSRPGMDRG